MRNGQRFTQSDHLPPDEAKALALTRQTAQAQADAIGSATYQAIADLLASDPANIPIDKQSPFYPDDLRTFLAVLGSIAAAHDALQPVCGAIGVGARAIIQQVATKSSQRSGEDCRRRCRSGRLPASGG